MTYDFNFSKVCYTYCFGMNVWSRETNLVVVSLSLLVAYAARFPVIGTARLFFDGITRVPLACTVRSPSPVEGDISEKDTLKLKLCVGYGVTALKKVILLSL